MLAGAMNRDPAPATTPAAPAGTLAERLVTLRAALAARSPDAARLAWLLEQARRRTPPPPALRTEANLVPGCLSRLWLAAEFGGGRCRFVCDSDSQVVRAVAGLLCELADDLPPAEILAAPADLPARLGLDRLLTVSRRAAQARVWERIQAFARAHAGDNAR